MTCKACEERRKKLKHWAELASESYRNLINRDVKVIETAKRKSRKTDRASITSIESDPVVIDGTDGERGGGDSKQIE